MRRMPLTVHHLNLGGTFLPEGIKAGCYATKRTNVVARTWPLFSGRALTLRTEASGPPAKTPHGHACASEFYLLHPLPSLHPRLILSFLLYTTCAHSITDRHQLFSINFLLASARPGCLSARLLAPDFVEAAARTPTAPNHQSCATWLDLSVWRLSRRSGPTGGYLHRFSSALTED